MTNEIGHISTYKNVEYYDWLVGIVTASLMTTAVSDSQIEVLVRVARKTADEIIRQKKNDK